MNNIILIIIAISSCILAVQDFNRFNVNLLIIIIFLGGSILNYVIYPQQPASFFPIYNIIIVSTYVLIIKLSNLLNQIGLGDFIFLAGLAFLFPVQDFLLINIISHAAGIIMIFVVHFYTKKSLNKIKIPQISIYFVISSSFFFFK